MAGVPGGGFAHTGHGGIMTARDALEFILAGATAVAVGTGNFVNPRATLDVLEGIEQYMVEHGFTDINELVGLAQRYTGDN